MTEDTHRRVTIERIAHTHYTVTNSRGRTITVRTEAAGPHIRLSVADTGPGIPADKLGKIFEPLFTTKAKGVGLGLPTVRKIVEKHGGTIDVTSTGSDGTTATIWLPRHGDAQPLATDAAVREAAA